MKKGKHMLGLKLTAFDPKATLAARASLAMGLPDGMLSLYDQRMADRIDYTIPTWDRTDNVSRALVRLVAQSTNDGIWDWNLETDEVYYSPRWLELVGYLPNELPGHIDTFTNLLHPDDCDNSARTIAEYLAGARPEYRNEFRLQHKNGSWRWIFTHGIAYRDATGRAIRLVGTHTDITDRVHAAARLESTVAERTNDLQAARDRAVLTAAATTDFPATVSHDIRQPLQAMALQFGTLKREVTTPEGKRQLLSVERSLGSAMELLESLLEYIKLDAGNLKPRLEAVSIGNLLESLGDTFSLVAAQKGLRLTVLPTRLAAQTDRQMLGRILRNLISNAIKYTDHGRILVGCRGHDDHMRIEVWDTGRGIRAEHLRQIFWEFVQVRDAGQEQSGGLGLGLAIVDRLAKLLGHHIEVRSWPERGSVFAVDLPIVSATAAATPEPEVASAIVSEDPLASKLIAVIDDDQAVSKAIANLLKSCGAIAVCAADGDALLQALSGRRPDAVITDRNLGPTADGFTALTQLETHWGGALPSLILTGEYKVGDQEQANRTGRRVLHKPVWADTLLAALQFEIGRSV
jgi:PAS domain S-box-containing protein